MLDNNQNRLIVNLDDLRDYDRTMADGSVPISNNMRTRLNIPADVSSCWGLFRLLLQPMQYIPAVDGALTQLVTSLHDPIKHDILGKECQYTFTLIHVVPLCLLTDLQILFQRIYQSTSVCEDRSDNNIAIRGRYGVIRLGRWSAWKES